MQSARRRAVPVAVRRAQRGVVRATGWRRACGPRLRRPGRAASVFPGDPGARKARDSRAVAGSIAPQSSQRVCVCRGRRVGL
eukprot:8358689-Prorocentrum_lima.AAC.1